MIQYLGKQCPDRKGCDLMARAGKDPTTSVSAGEGVILRT